MGLGAVTEELSSSVRDLAGCGNGTADEVTLGKQRRTLVTPSQGDERCGSTAGFGRSLTGALRGRKRQVIGVPCVTLLCNKAAAKYEQFALAAGGTTEAKLDPRTQIMDGYPAL